MIETSLIRLAEAVQEGQTLSAGTKVVLPNGYEADIYGFIAIEDDPLSNIINMPPLGECRVLSNRVIYYIENNLLRFPIFKAVGKAKEQKYALYLLYIPKYFSLSSDRDINSYRQSMSRETPNQNVVRIKGIQIDDQVAYYYPDENDLYFESRSKFRGIGTDFAVITRRISESQDDIKYEIFDSYSVMIERNEKNSPMPFCIP